MNQETLLKEISNELRNIKELLSSQRQSIAAEKPQPEIDDYALTKWLESHLPDILWEIRKNLSNGQSIDVSKEASLKTLFGDFRE